MNSEKELEYKVEIAELKARVKVYEEIISKSNFYAMLKPSYEELQDEVNDLKRTASNLMGHIEEREWLIQEIKEHNSNGGK